MREAENNLPPSKWKRANQSSALTDFKENFRKHFIPYVIKYFNIYIFNCFVAIFQISTENIILS